MPPLIGADVGTITGEPILKHAKPAGRDGGIRVPPTGDEFSASRPGLQWQWTANHKADRASLNARPGYLRLMAQPENASLRQVPSILTQKLPAPTFKVDTKIEATGNGRSGLVLLGMSTAWVGVCDGQLVYSSCKSPPQVGQEPNNQKCDETVEPLVKVGKQPVYLRIEMGQGAVAQFSYSLDHKKFTPAGKPFTAVMGRWVGAQMGVFALGDEKSFADIDYFRVTPKESE